MSSTVPAVQASGVRRSYRGVDGAELEILKGIDLSVEQGEAIAIVGTSGAGKSTLLHLLGILDRPTRGEVRVGGVDVGSLADEAVADLRNRSIGFVFQFHHLLREFSAVENVMMPCLISGASFDEARKRAGELLDQVGLAHRLAHKPGELSGGEQQRVAVARALANRPILVLADEPTGNLDGRTSEGVHDLLFALREEYKVALAIVTHNPDLAGRADRSLRLTDGLLRNE